MHAFLQTRALADTQGRDRAIMNLTVHVHICVYLYMQIYMRSVSFIYRCCLQKCKYTCI